MDKDRLIEMLNNDLADEHAAILRYLIHSYLEGEDTAVGANLLSRSREEMWHMHWLGMVIGHLGGEPRLTPNPYPFDPTSRATILRSYIEYEEKLVPHYSKEAEMVGDPHIKRVLQREGWESAIHARKFQRLLDKLTPEEAAGKPGGDRELPQEFLDRLQDEVLKKYNLMLQQVRNAWVFQGESIRGWQTMDQAMEMMKQLAHFAEDVAENGIAPRLETGRVDQSTSLHQALQASLEDVRAARERHLKLRKDDEAGKHKGFLINLDLTLQQEEYQAAELEDWLKER